MEPEAPTREWFDYTQDDLMDTAKCKEVFEHMLRRLETDGHCRYVYHRLAYALFSNDLEEPCTR